MSALRSHWQFIVRDGMREGGVGLMHGPSSDLIKRRFDALLLASAAIVWWTNAAGEFVEEQPYWQTYTGQTWDEYRGNRWISCLHPDDKNSIFAEWTKALSTGSLYFTQGRIWSAKHEAYRAVQMRGIPIKNDEIQVEGWLGALTDVQDSIDINSLLQRTQEDLAASLKALRDREAMWAQELGRLRAREEQIQMLMREVNHRSQNLLGIVLAIAHRTWEAAPEDFMHRFETRVHALSSSHKLLLENGWQGADLDQLARSQLAHFGDLIGTRIRFQGAKMFLTPGATQTLGMAFHELATNAAKHGALSNERGGVEITWHIVVEGFDPSFAMEWTERGGPPTRKGGSGFGSTVLTQLVERTLGGTTRLDFEQAGVMWKLKCPLYSVLEGSSPPTRRPDPPAPIPLARGPRVLVVEDESFVALQIEQALQKADFRFAGIAARADDAISIIKEQGCEAAVLDVRLADGTSERIAELLSERSIPFVVLTAYSREQLPEGLREAPYLPKPHGSASLVQALHKCLGFPEPNQAA